MIGLVLRWPVAAVVLLPDEAACRVGREHVTAHQCAMAAGAATGALFAGRLTFAVGYRRGLILYDALVAAGWALLAARHSPWTLSAGCALHGAGVGALCTAAPAYIGEVVAAPARSTRDRRGGCEETCGSSQW